MFFTPVSHSLLEIHKNIVLSKCGGRLEWRFLTTFFQLSVSSPQELTVPGQDQSVAVETLAGAGGELEVHQVVAGLLGRQLPVEMVLVTGGPGGRPDQVLGPPHPQVHLCLLTVTTLVTRGAVGWRLTTVTSISDTLYQSGHQTSPVLIPTGDTISRTFYIEQ